jgi:hypothetical protein
MSRGFLLDTNVPSKLTRPQPDPRVAQWLEDTDDELMYVSVISIGEVCKGFTVHPEEHHRASLRQWLENELRPSLVDVVAPVKFTKEYPMLGVAVTMALAPAAMKALGLTDPPVPAW